MNTDMKKVSTEEFYKTVGGLDVHPTIISKWPYTSLWKLHRELGTPVVGKSVVRVDRGVSVTDYFLTAR